MVSFWCPFGAPCCVSFALVSFGVLWCPFGALCRRLAPSRVLWCSFGALWCVRCVSFGLVSFGVLWVLWVFFVVLWCPLVSFGVLWCSFVFFGVLGVFGGSLVLLVCLVCFHPKIFLFTPRQFLVLFSILWCRLVFFGVLWCFFGVLRRSSVSFDVAFFFLGSATTKNVEK